jgi:putative tryptophan/tyrosine transport system substrate-binding protein
MKRREFIAGLGGAAAWPAVARAQQPRSVPRVGYLGYSPPSLEQNLIGALRKGLRDLGYVDGQNIAIEYRTAGGNADRLPKLAAELVGGHVDVIVTLATTGALAAKQASNTIPIVVAAMADPARDGLVVSLARPGGNITGATFLGPELIPKRLELIKEVVPGVTRVAVLWHPGVYSEPTMQDMLKATETTASALRFRLQLVGAEGPSDFEQAFSAIRADRAEGLLVFPSPMLYLEHKQIVDFATRAQLPTVYPWREAVDVGGLIAYGASIPAMMKHAAVLVSKILKGTKPAEIPVEQPTKFELVINLKAAKALGIDIPPSLLARADEVIE